MLTRRRIVGLLAGLLVVTSVDAATIRGWIFRDTNGNGQRDADVTDAAQDTVERGIEGLTVAAIDAAGASVAGSFSACTGRGTPIVGCVTSLDRFYTITVPDNASYRIEISGLSSVANGVLRPGIQSPTAPVEQVGSNSSVQFVTVTTGTTDNINFAVQSADQYCTSNPDIATSKFLWRGNDGTTNGTLEGFVSFGYQSGTTEQAGTTNQAVNTASSPVVVQAQNIGSTWGVAYDRRYNALFAAAFTRRHVPFVAGGIGRIYRMGTSGAQTPSVYVDFETTAFRTEFTDAVTRDFGAGDRDPHDTSDYLSDTPAWDEVGKTGFGDIDVGPDGRLYAIALQDRRLYRMPVLASPSIPSATDVAAFSLPAPSPTCTNGVARPFALGFHDGRGYVGVTCTAESAGGTADDLRAVVFEFDPSLATPTFTQVFNLPLNYGRGCASQNSGGQQSCTTAPSEWRPWTNSSSCGLSTSPFGQQICPQPVVSDLVFDEYGYVTVMIADRLGWQAGNDKTGAGTTEGTSAGEILRVARDSAGAWTVESQGQVPGMTRDTGNTITTQFNPAGSGGGTFPDGLEWYWHDDYNTVSDGIHSDITIGGAVVVPGTGEVLATAFDPVPAGPFRSGGVAWFSNWRVDGVYNFGERTRSYLEFPQDEAGTMGKAAGLGDMEAVCGVAPLQVGNRVWRDEDGDGIQDPGEPGISGVTLNLVNAAGTTVGTTTTDANGNWYFLVSQLYSGSDANLADANVQLLEANLYGQAFSVMVANTDSTGFGSSGGINGLRRSPDNTDSGVSGVGSAERDSNGVVFDPPGAIGSSVGSSLTLPSVVGQSVHGIDFGFVPLDFGDLPDTGAGAGAGNYETLLVNGGARNLKNVQLRIGAAVGTLESGYDAEATGVSSSAADGDDSANVDDENGLTSFPALRQGTSPTVTLSVLNNTGATRNLCGYLDFNNDGDFADAGEAVTTTVPSNASAQNVNLAFTGSVSASQTYANNNLYGRFRVQENACDPNGYGGAGEVEDYAFPVAEVGVAVSAIPDFCPGQSVVFTITLTNAASRATATAFPFTADLVGADEAGLAGIPSFGDANWAVTSTTGGATLATSTGNGVDINTTATLPANSTIVITVQATVANGVSLARTVAADVRPAVGSVDALASNDDASGSSTLGSCGTPPSGRGALCPVTTGLPALADADLEANTVVNGYWAGAAAVTVSPSPANLIGRCVQVGSIASAAGASTAIAAGDLLLLVQMQGATISNADTSSYGDGAADTPGGATAAVAGTHEYVIAQGGVQATGAALSPCAGLTNVIEVAGAGVAGGVINSYAHDPSPAGGGRSTFQVVRVPRYASITFGTADALTAPGWDGLVGGVIAVDVIGTVDLNGSTTTRFNASGLGFRGGQCVTQSAASTADTTLFRLPAVSTTNARKGEGYAGSPCDLANVASCAIAQGYPGGDDGKGAPGSAGGGGQHCVTFWATGGGGGAGGGAGGRGGDAGAVGCGGENRTGHGGGTLPADNSSQARLLLGGGGGAGARRGASTTDCSGGAGGGIVVIRANAIISASGTPAIMANASVGQPLVPANSVAGGGGGGGGTIMLLTNLAGGTTYANAVVSANGGAGGNARTFTNPLDNDGAGGGGGGGRVFVAATAAAPGGTRTATGGATGATGNPGLNGAAGFDTLGIDPVNASPGVKPGFVCDNSSTVPVTIAQVESRNLGSELEVRFVTASEAGTLGYHVYADGDAGRTRLSRELVLASSDRGLEKQEYVVRGPQLGASSVTIEEVDVTGKSSFYGPYPLDRSVGERDFTQATDWASIQTELQAWQSARVSALRGQGGAQLAELGVSADGWYRVTGAQLQAAGVDLSGVPVAELGLFVGDVPVPMQVEGGATVTATTALSFYGRAVVDNLYTTRQVYRLQRQTGPRLMPAVVATGSGSVTSYRHVERQAPNVLYSFGSPLADPWYASRIVRQGTTSPTSVYTIPVSERESGEAEVIVTLYGGTDLSGEAEDHHAVLRVNGQTVASAVFDGFAARTLRATVDAGLLTPNTTVEVGFGETPYSVDVLHVESVELRYPRRLELLDGELRMAAVAGGDQLLRSGFESTEAVCTSCGATEYVVTGVNPAQPLQVLRLEPSGAVSLVGVTRDGSSVRFATPGGEGVELLVTQRVRSATVDAGRVPANLLTGSAKLLVISHASFIESPQSELNRLLQARQAEGLSTKVVDVQDLYRAYSGGVTDAQAIAAYVRDAVTALGTRYVLLVGGDTYDYGNHLNLGSVSFVPTLYTPTSPFVRFAPADGMLADLDGDRRPNIAVGRLPVRTVAELNRMVDRILSPASGTTALLVSDREQAGYRYSEQNDLVASGLPSSWTRTHLKLDNVPQGQAGTLRQQLAAALGQGQSLLSWYGHSSPSTWSREGLLTAPQVYGGLLTNASPTTVVQWGCWGAYFVDPRYNTLAHAFLLNASGGAASFIGATALTETVSDTALGERLKPLLAEPVRIGDALLEATLALPPGPFDDVTVGTVILGDPTARIRR
jgi:hypothetical protein